ncbi:MAG: TlyA family RNA methyltransferase [Clostridiales bacterium]|nr:TlyA family RNA methyltransferase [Clostridiales bacterium]
MRLDNYLVENGFFDSRTKAKQAIERGEIYLNNKQVFKPALIVEDKDLNIEYVYSNRFVSLGGYKLNKAIKEFNFDCNNLVVADIGASTGGFTDCLLQNGAKKVYPVDLNDGLLHNRLKNDHRVTPVIKNARELTCLDFDEELDLIVADLSFISITYVIEVFSKLLKSGKHLIILVKPQFEIGQKTRVKNGIVRDEKLHKFACDNVENCAERNGFAKLNSTCAPIVDGKNIEFLFLFKKID